MGDFDIEVDPVYPWVKFIPKEPVAEASAEYRHMAFLQMHEFIDAHKLTGAQIWIRLEGDPFEWNKDRAPDRQIYGIVVCFIKEHYGLRSDGAEWLSRYESAPINALERT